MKTNTMVRVGVGLLVCVLVFWLGKLWGSRGVISYRQGGWNIAFHRDWPSYGLPIAEYTMLLSELRSGRSEQALNHLESLLDMALWDAERRRPFLDEWGRTQFDKSLSKAAQYRKQFPRPLSQGAGFFLTADRQSEIDRFLQSISSKQSQPCRPV